MCPTFFGEFLYINHLKIVIEVFERENLRFFFQKYNVVNIVQTNTPNLTNCVFENIRMYIILCVG